MILIHRDCISNSSSILYAYLSYLLEMSRDSCASKNKATKEEIIVSLFDHQGHANIPSKIQLICLSLSCFIAASALGQNPNYNWPSQNLNIHNSRFAELDQINRDNVSRLTESWTFTPGPQDSITQVTPLVAEGTMYLHSANTMFALDAALSLIHI